MRKIVKAGICLAAVAVIVTGCGKAEQKETTAAATTAAEAVSNGSITLGTYTGLELTKAKVTVSDEEVDQEMSYLRSANPDEVTGRAAAMGDTANIDYVGEKDGVAFAGGTADGYDLTLGSGSFIPGFEEGVVGMNVGDKKDVEVTFPDPYDNNPDLAGQPVVFHVTLNALKAAGELDDAFAKKMMGDENATLETYRAQVYDQLLTQKERNAFLDTGNQAIQQVIEASEITCDPAAVEEMYQNLQDTYTAYASQYGMDLETFLSLFFGIDMDGLKENSENLVKQQMVLDEVAKKEKLEATDEQKEGIAIASGFANAQQLILTYGEESANQLFTMEATYHYLVDNSNVTELSESELTALEESAAEETTVAADTTAAGETTVAAETTAAGETTAAAEPTTKAN